MRIHAIMALSYISASLPSVTDSVLDIVTTASIMSTLVISWLNHRKIGKVHSDVVEIKNGTGTS